MHTDDVVDFVLQMLFGWPNSFSRRCPLTAYYYPLRSLSTPIRLGAGMSEEEYNQDCSQNRGNQEFSGEGAIRRKYKKKHKTRRSVEAEDEQEINGVNPLIEGKTESEDTIKRFKKKKGRLLKEAARADNRGICYFSRIPPHMDHVKLRHILSHYGEIQKIYLAPAGPTAQLNRKRAGNQDQEFSEGWVEFTYKSTAKRVANMLNGEQIGGKKRSQFYYDLWNIKYLSKFKWDNLTEEIAYKTAIREQKIALEISAAKRERDFYLNKVDKSHALSSIEERLKKQQKLGKDSGGEASVAEQAPKVVRHFPQKKAVVDRAEETKSQLSKDILAGVFGGYK